MIVAQNARPRIREQAELLIERGIHDIAGIGSNALRAAAGVDDTTDAVLVLRPERATASALTPLLRHDGRAGFVVTDMPDVDHFRTIDEVTLPDTSCYLLHDIERGDTMAGWSPDEALPAILSAGRTPLTLTEGIFWLLVQPEALERNHCFMTVGSRFRKSNGHLDARTPAIWISNGTGRDGSARRHAPKVGWCWAGNRHTWLGFASAAGRSPLPV